MFCIFVNTMKKINTKKELTEIINSTDNIILVKFGAEWCNPCNTLNDYIYKIENTYKDNVIFLSVDVDKNEEIIEEYNIKAIPKTLLFKNSIIIDRFNGLVSSTELINRINIALHGE